MQKLQKKKNQQTIQTNQNKGREDGSNNDNQCMRV